MFKNYLKIAFRNILKQKFYSSLNILGLALLIALPMVETILPLLPNSEPKKSVCAKF